ncbi:hypothetical protein B0H17DRAFT_1251884 [Mycena rosella]|uniref:Arrestin-like N-terminal domain-containing protein n=1 Tax=Mycena rosella TaxID=1033263 RepID=A0AAD7CWP4_MYCRO|nr:hypothetical protein B0H17DRAFT_1251884 [Mycena rosella]
MSSPPVYEAGTFIASASLPAYSRRDHQHGGSRGSTEHIFSLKDQKNKIQPTLKLFSSAPTSASLPTFLEGDKINGSLALHIPRGEKICRVSIVVRGEILTGPQPQNKLCFLDILVPFWSKFAAGTVSPPLSGDCHWPFSIDIPKDVVLPDPAKPGTARTYALPQTFLERNSKASAHYYLSVQITRSALLFRENNELQTMFVYVPAVRPDPPSTLRQLAYQENMPIPGPEIDADGWYTCPMVTLKGTVFSNRKVEVRCILSLAKPLSYTRGSAIPCSLIYFCQDLQALNLLCTPTTVNLRLHRQVKCRLLSLGTPYTLTTDAIEESGRAVWWPANTGPPRQDGRRFDGEIHLPKGLKPTSTISHFTLKYFVVMLPFDVTGFSSANIAQPLIQQEVQIATIFAKGPRPRHYVPGNAAN